MLGKHNKKRYNQTFKFTTKGAWNQNVGTQMGSDPSDTPRAVCDSNGQKGRLNINNERKCYLRSVCSSQHWRFQLTPDLLNLSIQKRFIGTIPARGQSPRFVTHTRARAHAHHTGDFRWFSLQPNNTMFRTLKLLPSSGRKFKVNALSPSDEHGTKDIAFNPSRMF